MDALVRKYRRALFGFILNLTGNEPDADDVFQETWLRAVRNMDRYREKNLCGWLMRIARNIVIDRVRLRKPQSSLDAEPAQGRPLRDMVPGKDPGPRRHLEARGTGRAIGSAVATLPVEQREVFLLRVTAGLSFKEISKTQGVSINTALARMQYALAKLRICLKEEYDHLGR